MIIINVILEVQSSEELITLSDLNNDGVVDILDVIVMINIILD